MPIIGAQKRSTEVGRIRLGIKTVGSNGKERPQKLSTLRFTSPGRHLIDEIGRLYGGDVRAWQAPSGPQWEVVTTVDEVPVYVPRQTIDPWMEMGGDGYIKRRCDTVTEVKRNVPCLCDPERRECKPTTRLSVKLADVPGLGVWRLESHGWNATEELGGDNADLIAVLPPNFRLPARLRVEPRREKKLVMEQGVEKIKTFDYMVPVLYVDGITSRQIEAGPGALAQIVGTSDPLAIEAGDTRAIEAGQARAIEAPPARGNGATKPGNGNGPLTPAQWRNRFNTAKTLDELRAMWTPAGNDGALDEETRAAYKAAAQKLLPPAAEREATQPEVDGTQPEVDGTQPEVDGTQDWAALIAHASDLPTLQPLMEAMNEAKVTDAALKQAWWARKRELADAAEGRTSQPEPAAEAEVEPDPNAVWTEILTLAGKFGWSTSETSKRMREAGCDPTVATGQMMAEFRDALKSGDGR
jgi:Recombination directionality factor-like